METFRLTAFITVLFSVVVLYWVTSHDNRPATTAGSGNTRHGTSTAKDYALGTLSGADSKKSYANMDRTMKVETHIVATDVGNDEAVDQNNKGIFISVGHERTVDDAESGTGTEQYQVNRSSEDLVAYGKR